MKSSWREHTPKGTEAAMEISITSKQNDISYDITIRRGCLDDVGSLFDLKRKVLVVTDDGVPAQYARKVMSQSSSGFLHVIRQGEASKNLESFSKMLEFMLEKKFTRKDAVVAVGGGVVGDLAAFVAASYMRGVDFYNVPTTLLSQVDSSIGGKCGVDFRGVKNSVGAFRFPSSVLIDPNVLRTLSNRQLSAGLAEAIKMGLTSDGELFALIEKSENILDDLDDIIVKSLRVKADVVASDPFETGLRKVLNFGHTIGHAVESLSGGSLLHGECVAIGMTCMCSDAVLGRLLPVLEKYGLPSRADFDPNDVMRLIGSDKKSEGDFLSTVHVGSIGSFEFRKESPADLKALFVARQIAV